MRNIFLLDLHQFDEGSVGAADAAPSVDGLKADNAIEASNDAKDSNDNSLAKSEETKKPSFEDLIKGEYKEDYNKSVEKIVKNRFKNTKDLQSKLDSYTPLREALASRYGLEADAEVQDFVNAIYDDDMLYENESLERNIPVDELKRMKRMERENNEMRRMLEQEAMERENAEFIHGLLEEAAQLQQIYPDFDFDFESLEADTKDTFATMLKAGVPMKNAYESLHPEIFTQAMGIVANKAAERVANSVKANKNRAVEGGSRNFVSSPAGIDINSLTKEQLDELIERSAHEKIYL